MELCNNQTMGSGSLVVLKSQSALPVDLGQVPQLELASVAPVLPDSATVGKSQDRFKMVAP